MAFTEILITIGMKALNVFKSLPLRVLLPLCIIIDLVLFAPYFSSRISEVSKPWWFLGAIFLHLSAILLIFTHWWQSHKMSVERRRTFHLTLIDHLCNWYLAKQEDGSSLIQLNADLIVKNRTKSAIKIISVRVIKSIMTPETRGEIKYKNIIISMEDYSSVQNKEVPPGKTRLVRATIFINSMPKNLNKSLKIKLGITDEEGNEQKIKILFKPINPGISKQKKYLETPFSITNKIEKQIASVLQSELALYEKCDRKVGGLGSIHLNYPGYINKPGVGHDSWNSNSPNNQNISKNPETASLHSENLDTLLKFYKQLSKEEQIQFVSYLVDRLDKDKGYLSVSYFIVCVLWKIGELNQALEKAKMALPEEETKVFGLSNVLKMLNGLLYHRHPDFSDEILDMIEQFVSGLKREHTYSILVKINAIRTLRLNDLCS